MADLLSDTPTLPQDQSEHAQRSDFAVELPTKHCAFIGCNYKSRGFVDSRCKRPDIFMLAEEKKLIDHLVSAYKRVLQPVADELHRTFGDAERVCYGSAYNEAIAVAIRRGALWQVMQ